MLIEHTFVINLKKRNDRWKRVNEKFKGSNLKLIRWDAVYGKELSVKYVSQITTDFCRNFCSSGTIGCWLSHYNLWKHISNNNLNNVLILEDDANPIKDFNKNLSEFLTSIPNDYDVVYLGCCGSCGSTKKTYSKSVFGKENEDFNEKLMIPAKPLCTHAYLISNKGAKKLLGYDELKKINYDIDHALADIIYLTKSDFKVYASKISLIDQSTNVNDSDIITNEHPVISYPLSFLEFVNNCTLDYAMNIEIVYIRKLSVDVSIMMITLFLISFLIGLFGSENIRSNYLFFLVGLYVIETIIKRTCNYRMNFNNTLFEFFVIVILIYVGIIIKDLFWNILM